MKSFQDYGIDLPDYFAGDRKTLCPQCSATRKKKNDPCLSVNGETGMWHCHNCGWSGCRDSRTELDRTIEKIYRKPEPRQPEELLNIDKNVLAYFRKRGISASTLKETKVFSCWHYLPGTREETLSMAFPYYKNGELVNVKYRDANKNMAQEKDPEPCLWNLDAIKEAQTVYITEGEIDALTLVECGFKTAVSVDKGAPQPDDEHVDKKLECVTRHIETLKGAEWVVICSDKDEPGQRLEKELLRLLGPSKCKICLYPDGCKDINEVLTKCGRKAVVDAVLGAKPAPVPGLRKMAEFREEIMSYWRKGQPRGLTTGYPELDEKFTFQLGSVNVFTGVPQSGKSEFLHQLVINAIKLHGWKAAVFSPEMLPVELLFSNFAEKLLGKPFFGASESRISYQEMQDAIEQISADIQVILPDADKTPTLPELLTSAQVCVDRYGCKMFVLDPYNEIEHTRDQWMTETEYVSWFMARLRKFARQNKVWVGLVAHPTKLRKDEKSKKYPVATLYDISGSANFANKTDNGISLWRDTTKKDNIVHVHILKIKNKHIGKANSMVAFEWDRSTGRFSVHDEHRYTKEDCPPEPPKAYKD